ncbi:MAG: TRAP transporter substrate-binding protein [Parvularculaceae bacterium]
MHRRRFVLSTAGALGLGGCGRAGERPLYSADTHAGDYPTVRAVDHMAAILREKSGGRLDIRTYAGGQLGSERDTLEITIFGGLDMNRVNLAPLNPIAKETFVPALPFAFRSIAHMRAVTDGAAGQKILDALVPHGLVGLCYYDSGARSVYNAKRPVRTPDDMAGMKLRVQNSDLYVAMIEALGGDATPMSFSEVYQGILQGVIDGAENNWPSYQPSRHFEVAKHYTRTEHVMAPEILVINARSWRKLTDADQALMVDAARASVPVMRKLWDERVAASREIIVASGVEVVELDDKKPFQDLMAPVYERFLDADLQNLFQDVQSTDDGRDV